MDRYCTISDYLIRCNMKFVCPYWDAIEFLLVLTVILDCDIYSVATSCLGDVFSTFIWFFTYFLELLDQ